MSNGFRVVLVHRERYLVRKDEKELYCTLTGSLRYRDEFPVVGDYVEVVENPYGDSLIQAISPRKTVFCRPDRRGHADHFTKTLLIQPLVANVDAVFIITSLNHDFSVNRIARYASMAVTGGAEPVAVLTKADLCPNPAEMEERVASLSKDIRVISISAYTGYGMNRLRETLKPGQTIALLGSSGAGKSTLINALAGREIMNTGEIREVDSKGRHTTTHRELIELDGVSLIDTPGLRELGMIDAEEGIAGTFSDIADLITQCAFSDCTHRNEPGCAVRKALENGTLSLKRWETFNRLEKENNWSKVRKNEFMMNVAMKKRKLNRLRRSD